MSSVNETECFETLGISLNSREFQILKYILQIREKEERQPTFADIEEMANASEDEPFSKQWIYRCLKNLEENKFITIDRINKPMKYSTSLIDIRTGFSLLADRKTETLHEKWKQTASKLEMIQSCNTYNLAYYLVNNLSGNRAESRSGVIEGVSNIRHTIAMEICERSRMGDIIRINNRRTILEIDANEPVSIERMLLETCTKNVRMRALLDRAPLQGLIRDGSLIQFMAKEKDTLLHILNTGNLEICVTDKNLVPYRMLALNSDKLFLFLADKPKTDTVALIDRNANPMLLDEAVKAFDETWRNSRSINDVFLGVLNSLESGQDPVISL
jgi:hypothetical protein